MVGDSRREKNDESFRFESGFFARDKERCLRTEKRRKSGEKAPNLTSIKLKLAFLSVFAAGREPL